MTYKICRLSQSLTLALLLISANSLLSNRYSSDCGSSGCDKERTCSVNPLYCDGFNIQFHGGVSPIIWANRGCMSFLTTSTSVVSCASVASCPSTNCSTLASTVCPSTVSTNCATASAPCISPVVVSSLTCSDVTGTSIARVVIPKFSDLFETPWTVGTTLGYAISNNHEVFAEFNYTQAANKREYFTTNVTNAAGRAVLLQTNLVAKYKNASAYFGYRYNFDRGCYCLGKSVSWFLDVKAGMLHHFGVKGFINSSLTSSIVDGSTVPFFNVFKSNTTFSGAGEVGVDICLNCDWSLMIGAEVAANWGPSCHVISFPVTELASNAIKTAKVGAEILFPVTFGLRYKF